MHFILFSSLHMNECVSLCSKGRSMVWHKLQRNKIIFIAAVLKVCNLQGIKILIHNPWGPNYLLFRLKSRFPESVFLFLFRKFTWHCITGNVTQRRIKSNLKAEAFIKCSCTMQIQIKAASIKQILHHSSYWTQERAAERTDLDLQTGFFVIKKYSSKFC